MKFVTFVVNIASIINENLGPNCSDYLAHDELGLSSLFFCKVELENPTLAVMFYTITAQTWHTASQVQKAAETQALWQALVCLRT